MYLWLNTNIILKKLITISYCCVYRQNAKFPAVTICNMNMLRFDKLPDSYIDDIIDSISPYGKVSRTTVPKTLGEGYYVISFF